MSKIINKKNSIIPCIALSSLLFPYSKVALAEHTVDLKIVGIKGVKAIESADIYTKQIDKEEMDGSERYQQLVKNAIEKSLRVYGYYSVAINFSLQPATAKNKPILVATVNAGKQTLIENAEIEIKGEAKTDPEFQLLEKKAAKKGDMLYHSIYDQYKNDFKTLALSRGYFDSFFEVSRLEVKPSTYQAWWKLIFNSGQRYKFGKFTFKDSQIREDYLRNMMPMKTGDDYLINKLSMLTNEYSSSNWFNSVLLQPQIDSENKLVNVEVLLYPRKKNAMNIGIGYTSDVGPRFQLGWRKPWINDRGHSFRTNLFYSSPRQSVEATYKVPLLKNPLKYYYEISAGLENETENDTDTTAITLAALRYWNREKGWQHSLGIKVRYDAYTQAGYTNKSLLVYPTASINRTRLQGGLFPQWGDSQKLTIDVGNKIWGSDTNFIKIQASTAWLRTFEKNHRVIARAEIGWLHTKNINNIPPLLRFFAGGDRSVRGYGYKKIAPKNKNNKLVGGNRLLTTSLEYQYQIYDQWWLATFADSGFAANDFKTSELRYGTGVGIRWASPVGAIKLDIATPIRDKNGSKNIQFYIGLGSEL
ncbi:autotransporter secretion outer membrane protein TamA [Bisgaardia hudsonensis]|uniref:Translocation and assembly module subunit TamA n=1 Tax=Bisgaardia hudsonensis TaxID=109472 RepID=A0A4R2MXB2_9PAST|nr:autotransporter assembly complex family protein [Bisgaardia hudsonensis]QLB12189.1 hypothetical protein A6A11_00445 [Bisgaardia hudsonensis]TCP12227.1 autotransporter secretion outer membrane protein TamA [Bisgaardia hudsonensis]